MTPILANLALALGGSPAASIIAKVTLIMALALVGVRLAHKTRASLRHALLATAFAVSLVLPLASVFAPPVQFAQVPITASRIADSPALPPLRTFAATAAPMSAVSNKQAIFPPSHVATSGLLRAAWVMGALLFLLPMVVGLWRVYALRRLAQPWQQGQLVASQLAADAHIHHHVEVLLHRAIISPVTCGILKPAIILPRDAQAWLEGDLSRAIIHELEHVRRSDWMSQSLARAVCACYWFHPLVWMAWRQLRLEAERACDDAVLQGAEPTDYAHQLVGLAKRMSSAPHRALLTMANRTDLAARVAAILDGRQQRGRAGTFAIVLLCLSSAVLVITISPLRIVAAQRQAPAQTFIGSLRDPLGRTLPDTRLTLWNLSTQLPIEAQSDQAGHFAFRGLPVGEYELQVHEFGWQGRLVVAPGQHLNRNVAALMGMEDEVTVHSNEAPPPLPPILPPLPPASSATQPDSNPVRERCAQVSMFCRVTPPVQTACTKPVYPAKPRDNGIAATVVVEARVGTNGLLKDMRAVAPADPDFVNATLDALRRWQFTPMRFDGIPVEMNIRVTANFLVH